MTTNNASTFSFAFLVHTLGLELAAKICRPQFADWQMIERFEPNIASVQMLACANTLEEWTELACDLDENSPPQVITTVVRRFSQLVADQELEELPMDTRTNIWNAAMKALDLQRDGVVKPRLASPCWRIALSLADNSRRLVELSINASDKTRKQDLRRTWIQMTRSWRQFEEREQQMKAGAAIECSENESKILALAVAEAKHKRTQQIKAEAAIECSKDHPELLALAVIEAAYIGGLKEDTVKKAIDNLTPEGNLQAQRALRALVVMLCKERNSRLALAAINKLQGRLNRQLVREIAKMMRRPWNISLHCYKEMLELGKAHQPIRHATIYSLRKAVTSAEGSLQISLLLLLREHVTGEEVAAIDRQVDDFYRSKPAMWLQHCLARRPDEVKNAVLAVLQDPELANNHAMNIQKALKAFPEADQTMVRNSIVQIAERQRASAAAKKEELALEA